jgi:MraZ protein
MFRGQAAHTVDDKGRVHVPSRFRGLLSECAGDGAARPILVTPAPFDRCLHIYPLSAFEDMERELAKFSNLDPNVVHLKRRYLSAAAECEIDKAGRVLIPASLRQKVGLDKEVLWAGMGKHLELWAHAEWERALELSPEEEQAFRRAILEQIRI